MYHAVDTKADPMGIQVTPRRLRQQLEQLRRLGLRGVSMRELLEARTSRARLVGLTFDDGYADFATTAVPILAEFGFTATVFVVAGHVSGTNDWDPPPRRPLMTAEQLRSVENVGHEIGAHGMRHVRLDAVASGILAKEVLESKAALEHLLRVTVTGFAYPYGVVSADAVAAVRNVYHYACAIKAAPSIDRWTLPRVHVGERDGEARLTVKLAIRPVRERLQRRSP
jgi:peptidoglycan/xylan/chitin deacetylase (PgdA/CDA1 family)